MMFITVKLYFPDGEGYIVADEDDNQDDSESLSENDSLM